MEYKYYRELKHNYLVFEMPQGTDKKDRYPYKIVESGRIRRLVPCSERSINGESYIYYEINSMQTLRDRFLVSRMDYQQTRNLLLGIKELLEELSEYLLGEDGVVFNVNNIYTDLTSGEIRLIYCPFFDESKDFREFAMELLDLVDEKDERASGLVYRLCEDSASEGRLIYDVLSDALEEGEELKEDDISFPVKRGVTFGPVDMEESALYDEEDENDEGEESMKPTRMQRAEKRLGGKVQLLFCLLFFCVVAAMVYIRKKYILSDQENMLSILVMLVSTVTGMVALVGGIRQLKPEGDKEVNKREDNRSSDEYDSYEDVTGTEITDDIKEDYLMKPLMITGSFINKGEKPEYNETVVLDDVREDGMTLFSRNLDKTVRIALDRLPITVGKMEGCVDRVLSDKSVSRMHCRFIEEGDRIGILDLGSTNGTYRNGVKLSPHEVTYIEEGDEIRIGRVCFDCR